MAWRKYDFVPDSYSQNMMTWHKYDFVPDSYSQNMMTWHKYDFVPLIYVGGVETLIIYQQLIFHDVCAITEHKYTEPQKRRRNFNNSIR